VSTFDDPTWNNHMSVPIVLSIFSAYSLKNISDQDNDISNERMAKK
jgi:hypothetical protein